MVIMVILGVSRGFNGNFDGNFPKNNGNFVKIMVILLNSVSGEVFDESNRFHFLY